MCDHFYTFNDVTPVDPDVVISESDKLDEIVMRIKYLEYTKIFIHKKTQFQGLCVWWLQFSTKASKFGFEWKRKI